MDELYRLHTEMDLFSIVFIRGLPISICGGRRAWEDVSEPG